MSLWRQLTRGLRVLTNRNAADRDVADEVQHYLEQATDEHIARGLSPENARRAARVDLGSAATVREQVRADGWENIVGAFFADLRYGFRRLRRTPGFTVVSVLTLALGIGASTAIFSAVNPILFEPLPYPHAGRIMMIWDIFQGERSDVTFHTYREVAQRSHSFEALAVMERWQPAVTGAAEPERLEGQSVTAGYFRVLGIPPAMGRDFEQSDEQPKGAKIVILSDSLWRRRFNRNRAIIGRQVTLDDDLYTVVGVMPQGLDNVLAASAEIWSPMQYDPGHVSLFETSEWGHHLHMVGRLRPGVGADTARQDIAAIARARVPEFPRPPWASLSRGLIVNSLQGEVTRGIKPALLAVLGAVMLLLLIACVNVTNLVLARGAQRRGEFAMRAALGAWSGRLVRQLLTESLLLALIGGALGMFVAQIGVHALVALSPPELPRVSAIRLDGSVLLFGIAITTLIGLVVGLAPALSASRSDPHSALQQASRSSAGGHQLARRTLVVAEVAFALVLLVSAGLLLHSLERLFSVNLGFDSSHLLTMQVQTSSHRLDDDSAKQQFFTKVLDAVRQVPGVTAASLTSLLPMSGEQYGTYGANFENETGYSVFRYVVTPEYFETTGITLRRGRFLNAHDQAGAPPVAVISESLAKKQFSGQNALGQRLHVGPTNRPWYTIVGVAGDVKQTSLAESQPDAAYITTGQSWFADNPLSLVVRARGDAAEIAPAVRKAIWSVDKDQPIIRVATMDSLLAGSEAQRRFALILFEVFALVALMLTAVGIYGVLSGSVNERMREIGIRSALGASRGSILTLVVGQGLTLTGLGVAIGLMGALAASQAIASLLFGISRLDPVTYLGVIALLAGVSMIACWAPAWRAARVDPSITLRAE
jgi:putative ABC transport system permease protein